MNPPFNKCLKNKVYPYSLLSKRFAYRADVLQWCEYEYIEPPAFWMSDSRKPLDYMENTPLSSSIAPEQKALFESLVNNKHRQKNSKFDSMICQTIARVLWDEHPQMTIADMTKHKAIKIYGNSRAYSGKNTVRDWLSPIDPRRPEDKSGRKKKNGNE